MNRVPSPRNRGWRLPARVETALIVGLAALVVIKGSGAIGGVIGGIGQMFMAIFRW